ncbi:serine/threonine-protein kinase [Nocardia sp. NPDC051832]|uniref:serine/threonine-protein kinase n=1 Tax=Nocardia sp. NPDC051832 TaxID=3155673 RepID=UPI00343573C6
MEGNVFAGYRIERALGSGGMGTVYAAHHPRLPRVDALKVLSEERSGDSGFRAKFMREAEIAVRLHHPNLVEVRDRGEHDGRLWIAMQCVDGFDLEELIRRGQTAGDIPRTVRILSEAAQGMDEIHRAGLLHRDVKPANILIAEQPGGPDRVLVTDFGIARPADDATTVVGGGISATLAYAAPEQISGEETDHRADVYALGCTLFQMLTGTVPFPRDNHGSTIYAHLHEPPPRPSERNPRVPAGFDAVIATAMAKDPNDRYDSCGALAAAARAVPAIPGPPVAQQGSSRRRLVRAGAVLAALAVAVAGVWFVVDRDDEPAAEGPHRPVADSVDPEQWGTFTFIAEAVPALLPPWPYGVGYQDMTACEVSNAKSSGGLQKTATLDATVTVGSIECVGDGDPVSRVVVFCNADRTPIQQGPANAVMGDERWTRSSGSGHLFWGTEAYSGTDPAHLGKKRGVLDVFFDDPERKFCRIHVSGRPTEAGTTGIELKDRWWANAPL